MCSSDLARPRERTDEEELDEGYMSWETRKDHGAWCVDRSWQAIMKSGSSTLCFDRDGIRDGQITSDEEEGQLERITFTRT